MLLLTLILPAQAQAADKPIDEQREALLADLHRFINDGDLASFKKLLEKHPDLVNARREFRQPRKPEPEDAYTLLHSAAARGKTEIVEYLLSRKADPNARVWYDWTPLHLAAEGNNLGVVKALVAGGANISARTQEHILLLGGCGYGGPSHEELEGEGIPGAPTKPPTKIEPPKIPAESALDIARQKGHKEIVAFLEKTMLVEKLNRRKRELGAR
jgi:ankyrin repeat protein